MRRLLIIWLSFLAIITGAFGQLPLTGVGPGGFGSGFTPSCTQSTNWLARATNVVSTTDKQRYDALLCGLETDSIGCSSKIDLLYVFAAVDETTAQLNLCSASFSLTKTATVTFTQYVGYLGDGATGKLDTGYKPTSNGVFYTQNSASGSCYILSSRAADQNWSCFGTENTNFTFLLPKSGGNLIYALNSTAPPTAASANAQGSWVTSRTAAAVSAAYKNGAAFTTGVDVSGVTDNTNMYLFASDGGGRNSGDQISSIHIGGAMDATQAANFSTRINTFMTAYGINVY